MDIRETLGERGKTHGDFSEGAKVMVDTLRVWGILPQTHPNLNDVQIAGLIMDASKKSRIVAGNPNEIDHWRDSAGYNTLVADRIV